MKALHQLLDGYKDFCEHYCPGHREQLAELAKGQQPQVMLITCADSRIEPGLIFHAEPGDLFVLRNAGNIVPAFGQSASAEAGTIEFAVLGLKVQDIVVMGHTQCGAVRAMLNFEQMRSQLPALCRSLEPNLRVATLAQAHPDASTAKDPLELAVRLNVLVQVDNLLTHPAVAAAVENGTARLHAWLYSIETGQIHVYCQDRAQFMPLHEVGLQPLSFQWPLHLATP